MNAIEVKDLTKSFGKFTAVDHLSFKVQYGEIFGFLGANGAGKTTAIRMLTGLLNPTSGTANVVGYDIEKNPFLLKKNIGYMSQKFSLYEDLTPSQNIDFYAGLYNLHKDRVKQFKEQIFLQLQLSKTATSLVKELPLGFKQRLALGCAMIHNPKVLFLDEPTSGVDPVARQIFWDLIYEASANGITIFVTTHYMDEAEFCSRICILAAGKIIAMNSPSEIKKQTSSTSMQNAFLKIVKGNTGEF